METFNLNSDEWQGTTDREGWRIKGALVGERVGGELIGATMSEVEPGNRLWPYHTHYLNEEWVIVRAAETSLRREVIRVCQCCEGHPRSGAVSGARLGRP
jgi:uncharacterized cupin superfamily protein